MKSDLLLFDGLIPFSSVVLITDNSMLASAVTSFHRQANSERRFGMSSPSSSAACSLPVAAVAGIQASASSTSTSTATVTAGHSTSPAFSPDLQAQKSVLESLLERKLVEGDFWYVIVAEWLEQLKKYLSICSTRKYYGQRPSSPPGPILTRRDYAHTVDVVHEDAWRMLITWYGLAEGHKPMKLVVYKYARGPEIEHNINSFKIMMSNSAPEDFHIVRFSKMEKVGHVEHKARQLYGINPGHETRLWAKPEADTEWRPLFCRDKSVGVVLDMDSDFIRPVLALELQDEEGQWMGGPEETEAGPVDEKRGQLVETSMFEDVTATWEVDIHEQIEQAGKTLLGALHSNFNVFLQRAKDYVESREAQLRERERQLCARESVTERLATRLELKEHRLQDELTQCETKIKEYESRRLELEREFADREEEMTCRLVDKEEELAKEVAELREEKDKFQEELKRMAELHQVQESRIKLDIGGQQFTTSLLTLGRDPNSMLSAMFSGRHDLKAESDGSYFIDRDGTHFRHVLNYLRDGCVREGTLPHNDTVWRELLTEAEFFQLQDLADFLRELLARRDSG
ncbi:uncharacterized protein LOC101855924 [Aplysia californica]|uniref:Uncharacterized protein LOC101855924 n=1 Tax=Aplysia californica TaxID=6500 RepID=A0ABM0JDE1_APLCA|nr:uncharacterized protein LOC101855924 [Aplysia californica]